MNLIRNDVSKMSLRAAPLSVRPPPAPINVDFPVPHVYKRSRRRGPQNFLAEMRCVLPKRCRALPGMASRGSEASMPTILSDLPHHNSSINSNSINSAGPSTQLISSDTRKPGAVKKKKEFLISTTNIICLRKKLTDLECHLQQLQPHIVVIQETWLDASTE